MQGSETGADDVDDEVRGATAPDLRVVATFEQVYRSTHARLVRVAFMMTGSTEVAEDVVQDAFVELYPRFDRVADPAPYLYRSVVNGCGSRFRRRRVAERLEHLTIRDPIETFEVDETWSALDQLPPRRRAVIVLRFYADLPLAQVAEILGCRPGTVKSMQHRALAELKAVIHP